MDIGTGQVLPGLRCSPEAYIVKNGWIMYSICLCTYVREERYTEMMKEKRIRTSLLCMRSVHETLFSIKDTEDYVL